MIHGNVMHGMSRSLEYSSWHAMKSRCLDPKHVAYKRYAGNGITICPEWIDSFDQFYIDMGLRPGKAFTLERVNNNKGYCKENCRWATRKEQNNNRRNTIIIEIDGVYKSLTQWCQELNLNYHAIWRRIHRHGDDPQKALLYEAKPVNKKIEVNGRSQTIAEWSKDIGIASATLRRRINRGMDPVEAITKPLRIS